uniref:Uncharacterized protein n=1 Tax=Anopheles maculatus TaxID=74869 RepID=A0A182SZG2_9DIPT
MDPDNAQFTLQSHTPIGFESSRCETSVEICPKKDTGTDPCPLPTLTNVATDPKERKETATQTISAPRSKKFATYDDSKLVSFIRKVKPIVEEELSYGMTPIFDCNDNLYESTERYRRDRYGGSVQWVELSSNPVKACIESLETNPFNRDMFAGGTVSGDVYIWHYEMNLKNERNSFAELHSETTDCGKVVDMAWTRYSVMSKSDYALLTAHSEGAVILWRVGKTIVKDKVFKLSCPSANGKALILTQILATSNTEFVAGCDDGSLLLCSTTQLIPLGATSSSERSITSVVNSTSSTSTTAGK